MAKSLLRSGSLDDFLALGENGQPVYASALQLRETLRLRHRQEVADCLAIPQPNESGDRIDWYAPLAGKVISWSAANAAERAAALKQLETYQEIIYEINQRAQRTEKPGQKLFGALLVQAIQFPGLNHVYLVNGKPVLTFWGFVNADKKARTDAFDCLRQDLEPEPDVPLVTVKVAPPAKPAPKPAPKPEPEIKPQPVPEPVAAPIAEPVAAVEPALTFSPEPAKATPVRSSRRWLWLAALILLVLVPASTLWLLYRGAPELVPSKLLTTPLAANQPEKNNKPVIETPKDIPINNNGAKPTLPVGPALLAEKPVEVAPPPVVTAPTPTVVTPAEPQLSIPSDAPRRRSTEFLNGNWRITSIIQDQRTGKPVNFRYQFQQGIGIANVTLAKGVICSGNVKTQMKSSGELSVSNLGGARCSDGDGYKFPEITCKPGEQNIADCTGRYGNNELFPLTMKRESK